MKTREGVFRFALQYSLIWKPISAGEENKFKTSEIFLISELSLLSHNYDFIIILMIFLRVQLYDVFLTFYLIVLTCFPVACLFHNFNFILNVEFLSHNYELPLRKKKKGYLFFLLYWQKLASTQ